MSLNRAASYARGLSDRAQNVLTKIMEDEDAPSASRVAAAKEILDRGWGKPPQTIIGDEDNPLRVIQRIERVIIDPIEAPPY